MTAMVVSSFPELILRDLMRRWTSRYFDLYHNPAVLPPHNFASPSLGNPRYPRTPSNIRDLPAHGIHHAPQRSPLHCHIVLTTSKVLTTSRNTNLRLQH